jgi:hypothetical protein
MPKYCVQTFSCELRWSIFGLRFFSWITWFISRFEKNTVVATRENSKNDIQKGPKAELLQLKPHPFICMKNLINKKVGNQKN